LRHTPNVGPNRSSIAQDERLQLFVKAPKDLVLSELRSFHVSPPSLSASFASRPALGVERNGFASLPSQNSGDEQIDHDQERNTDHPQGIVLLKVIHDHTRASL
jgi:hypothetical protein